MPNIWDGQRATFPHGELREVFGRHGVGTARGEYAQDAGPYARWVRADGTAFEACAGDMHCPTSKSAQDRYKLAAAERRLRAVLREEVRRMLAAVVRWRDAIFRPRSGPLSRKEGKS